MDGFCWENLHRKAMGFLPSFKLIGFSGENFPIIQFYDENIQLFHVMNVMFFRKDAR